MKPASPETDRLLELSVDDALNELSGEDAKEYEQLRASDPEFDAGPTERAVGAALGALIGAGEALPDTVRSRLEADVEAHFGVAPGADAAASVPATATTKTRGPSRSRQTSLRSWSGWLAAAAILLLTIGLWLQSVRPVQPPSPAQARAALLESGRAVVLLKWAPGGDATGAQTSGDIIWDAERQVGYMRFAGLARNDPRREQYQLWIFDAGRDERYPVDGGLFDVAANGEVVIPIHAKLRVADVKLFAVTVERPGGVVVSDRARIAVLAKPG